ncbi:PIN domain-containing protein [bacterium]|nr:PIN domain-containing protein [bacterium]
MFFDTSVLVAASEQSHPHHEKAWPLLQSVVKGEATGIIGAHSLAELYAALTRLPVQPRIQPAHAQRIISENILPHFEIMELTRKDYSDVIQEVAIRGIPGARIYDALLLRCAANSSAERILTFNLRDFAELAPDTLRDKLSVPQ